MKSSVKALLSRFHKEAKRRPNRVVTRAMGRQRYFRAYDLGDDTFVFERGVWTDLDAHASVLMVEKRDLVRGAPGHLMTVTTGNHSVAALPLLNGLLWNLSRVSAAKRSQVMSNSILCANVVDGKLEISQRDVPCRKLAAIDDWLVGQLGFALGDVVFLDRNDATLECYRARGQEWRVKPLAWTESEMKLALAASRKRISTGLRYYHASRGVHFLSYPDFAEFVALARTDFDEFRARLRELVSVFEGNRTSFTRQPKYHGHHEIELFGLCRGVAFEQIIPQLEGIMEGIVLMRLPPEAAAKRADEAAAIFKSLLTNPDLADATSPAFVSTLYMHLTGEIYSLVGDGSTPAFDDRRTALPGATFVDGHPQYHPLADARSRVLLSNVRALMSKDEHVEYANVYELRGKDDEVGSVVGSGTTREIVYKTSRSPLVSSLVEKRLSATGRDYGSYVLARVQAFKSLGVALADYRLLRRRAGETMAHEYYIRSRCEGEPLEDVPSNYLQIAGEFGGADAGEDPRVVRALAFLMGDAAAQNMAMKKYDPASKSPLFGVGKEIYRFDYGIHAARLMPVAVSTCSIRSTLGWPDLEYTEENLHAIAEFYIDAYTRSLRKFADAHPVCPLEEFGEAFMNGFETRTRTMEWKFTVLRAEFESFDPGLPPRYGFLPKWRFALWAFERQARRLDAFRTRFLAKLSPRAPVVSSSPSLRVNPTEGEEYIDLMNF